MSAQWQYLQDGQTIGPVDEQDLFALFADSTLKASTPIRSVDAGESAWRPALTVAEFKHLFKSSKAMAALTTGASAELTPVKMEPAPTPMLPVFEFRAVAPVATFTAPQEGATVVKWMWRFAFAAWAVCFLPVPGVSTFLAWLFVAVASTLAFVALFKNRVGSGIGGTIALALVTPVMYFLSLWVYPLLFGAAGAVGALNERQNQRTDQRDYQQQGRESASAQSSGRNASTVTTQSSASVEKVQSLITGTWQDENSVCTYSTGGALSCNIDGQGLIERRWSLSGNKLEWHGGTKRYVYRIVEANSSQMVLENIFPESARGKRWYLKKIAGAN